MNRIIAEPVPMEVYMTLTGHAMYV